MMIDTRAVAVPGVLLLACACASASPGAAGPGGAAGADTAVAALATRDVIARHTVELASDRYQGRFPGTRGEDLSVAYIEAEMRRVGLAPGNPDGTYAQRLELVGQRSRAAGSLTIGGATEPLDIPGQAAFTAARAQPETRLRD